MIEKFTKEEIELLKMELALLDEKGKPKERGIQETIDKLKKLLPYKIIASHLEGYERNRYMLQPYNDCKDAIFTICDHVVRNYDVCNFRDGRVRNLKRGSTIAPLKLDKYKEVAKEIFAVIEKYYIAGEIDGFKIIEGSVRSV